jgi:lipopolysaccharide export system permease protein
MIFRRSLIHEMTSVALAVFIVLLMLIMTTQVVRLLGQAAAGTLASSAIWAMMGFAAVRYFPILLTLTLFIAVLATLTRAYKDHEMVSWQISGQSIRAFIKPVLQFAGFPILLIAVLSMLLSPWALRQSKSFRKIAEQQEAVTQVAPGVFRESGGGGGAIYFIENFSGVSGNAQNIFVQRTKDDQLDVIVAERGNLAHQGNNRSLHLANGYQYQGTPGQASYTVNRFERAIMPVQDIEYKADTLSVQSTDTIALLANVTVAHQAELHARLALPISAIILVLMAIPLAYYNSRAGGFAHLIFAIFIFFLYQNMVNVGQNWVAQGKIAAWIGLWPIHIAAAIVMWWLFHWRERIR